MSALSNGGVFMGNLAPADSETEETAISAASAKVGKFILNR